jgi:transporter family protein
MKPRAAWMIPSLCALFFWGLWGFLPKVALQTLPPHGVTFYESLGNFIITLPLLVYFRFRLEKNATGIKISALTGALTVIYITLCYYALRLGPVSVIITLTAMYPVVSVLLAWGFLKEKISPARWAAIIMAMGAVYLLAG